MSPPIRVKPTSLLSTSPRGSLLDGAYTAGVAYASPLRRGQMSPRFVLFLAAFTALAFLVSNFNSAVNIQPPFENEVSMEDHDFPAYVPCSFDIVPWTPPPRHQIYVRHENSMSPRPSLEKCPLKPIPFNDEGFCEPENHTSNLTDSTIHSAATGLPDSAPAKGSQYNHQLLAGLLLLLLAWLWWYQASKMQRRACNLPPLPQTVYTNNPTAKSFVDSWDLSTGSFVPASPGERLYFPEREAVSQAINGLSGTPSNDTPISHPSAEPSFTSPLREFFVRMWSCGMEVTQDIDERMSVKQGGASDRTFGTNVLSSGGSTSSFDETYDEFEVEEIGIDYY